VRPERWRQLKARDLPHNAKYGLECDADENGIIMRSHRSSAALLMLLLGAIA
jgi:hypothetical protein